MKSKPRDIAQLTGQHLAKIQQYGQQTAQLQQVVFEILEPELHPYVRVANIRNGTLVIELLSASWQPRLQYQRLDILSALRKNGFPMLSSIEFKINPALAHHAIPKPLKQTRTLSPVAKAHLLALAEQLDGELAQKIKRLATTTRNQPDS